MEQKLSVPFWANILKKQMLDIPLVELFREKSQEETESVFSGLFKKRVPMLKTCQVAKTES